MYQSMKKILSIAVACALSFGSLCACAHVHREGTPVRENVIEATCSKEGSCDEVIYCASCHEELSREQKTIEKTPHTPGEKRAEDEIKPSCTVAGSYDEVVICTVCGDEISRETKQIEKTNHKAGEPVAEGVIAASCTEAGSYDEVVYCLDCKTEISRTAKKIDKTEHKFTLCNDVSDHWYECDTCGLVKEKRAHIPGAAATETTAQKCTECNYVLAEPVGHTHTLILSEEIQASCLTAGKKAYYTCSGCGKSFEDSRGEKEIVNLNGTVIPASGHSFSEAWEEDENFHWHAATCEHSDEVSSKATHAYGEGITEGNEIVYTCTVCGKTKNQHIVTFDMNMEGMDSLVVYVNDGDRVEKPARPTREGFTFLNWYVDQECSEKFNFNNPIKSGCTLYASWNGTYVFEAEDTYLDDQEGKGFSNDAYGTDMIQSDYKGMANASGGYFVGYMYNNGVTVTFEIDSNKDDYNATLTLRLSGELVSQVTLTNEKYLVEVNGNKVNYSDITITDIDTDKSKFEKREFQDFKLGRIVLKKGRNIITLKVNNTDGMLGTMKATAPLLDCIKINTNASLVFKKYENPKP